MGYARLRLNQDQPDQALELLQDALTRQPQDADLRKNLGIIHAVAGQHDKAYATLTPYLTANPADQDALLIVVQGIYLTHAAGGSIESPESDRTQAAKYAQAYIAAKGPYEALMTKWMAFLTAEGKQ
jgi:tetratricopeptide (TPR) repeat protein